jgi:GNAT superfamily N-acetyltransferase
MPQLAFSRRSTRTVRLLRACASSSRVPASSRLDELAKPVPLDPRAHRTELFSCGVVALDRWLQAYAGQSQRRDAARTFVVLAVEGEVAAYYTLVATEIEHDRASSQVGRGMSKRFPIPSCLIARLAVDGRHKRTGLGAALLRDALARSLRIADEVGLRAVVVDASSREAADFCLSLGFQAVDEEARLLMISVAHLRAAAAAK